MNYIKSIQGALDYIEKNLGTRITLEQVANRVYISHYHFARIFKAIVGVTVHEYIRRRRLSEGAKLLLDTDKKILEIALTYGFESQGAFTKSFKDYFSCTPYRFRKTKPKIWLYSKGDIYLANLEIINLKGGSKLDYKIVELGELKLVGMKERIVMPNNTIPQLWEKFMAKEAEIEGVVNKGVYYGLADNMEEDTYEFDETVGVEVENFDKIPVNMTTTTIAPQKYLVFTHKGLLFTAEGESLLSKSYDYIYGKLLPSTEFEVDQSFNFELYDERFIPNSDKSEFDIYVPIK